MTFLKRPVVLEIAHWISIFQVLVVSGTLIFTAQRVYVAAEGVQLASTAASATTLERLTATSRELQLKTLDDKDLRPLLLKDAELTPALKRSIFISVIFNHYALVFDLRELGQIPDPVWDAFLSDMALFYRSDVVQARWNEVKEHHRKEFREFVSRDLLRRTAGP